MALELALWPWARTPHYHCTDRHGNLPAACEPLVDAVETLPDVSYCDGLIAVGFYFYTAFTGSGFIWRNTAMSPQFAEQLPRFSSQARRKGTSLTFSTLHDTAVAEKHFDGTDGFGVLAAWTSADLRNESHDA